MKEKKVLTTTDLVFKKVFASPQNSHILIGFIKDILGLEVEEVTLEDTYNIQSFYDEEGEAELRYTQVDVLARLKDGSLVGIEMQVYKELLYRERALYYTCQNYVDNYGKHELLLTNINYRRGEIKYSSLRPVYTICIMKRNEFIEDNEPVHEFILYDVKRQVPYKRVNNQDLFNLIFLELDKSSPEMQKNVKDWFDYFNRGEVSKSAPGYVREACKVASYQRLRKEEREVLDAKEKRYQSALLREAYVWQSGVQEGHQEGRQEGKQEERKELISTMIANGKTVDEIAEFTGIDKTDIELSLK